MKTEAARVMGIAKKIFLVAASFSLPIAVLVYFVIANIDQNIDIARLEMVGDAYQKPLEGVLHHIQQHQLLLHHCPAGADCAALLAAEKQAADRAVDDLKAATGKYGLTLRFVDADLDKRQRKGAKYETVSKEWQEIEAFAARGPGSATAELDAKYDSLGTVIRTMIAHTGDISTLILDPDLDTYYTMCNTVVNLPQTQDRLAHVIARGRDAIVKGSLTPAESTQLAVDASMLQEADLDVIDSNAQTALNEDAEHHGVSPSLQRNIPPSLKEFQAAQGQFIELTKRLAASSGKPAIALDEYIAAGEKAREASFRFWEVSVQELDVMLDQGRAHDYFIRKVVALLLSALALLIAGTFAFFVARSITKPLDKLARTLTPGATLLSGSVSQLAEASAKGVHDETIVSVICDELTAHAEDMRKTATELEVIVFGSAGSSSASR